MIPQIQSVISTRSLKEVIFKVVDLVDDKLGKEMKAAGRGSILHDGWTSAGVHYIALLPVILLEESKIETKS